MCTYVQYMTTQHRKSALLQPRSMQKEQIKESVHRFSRTGAANKWPNQQGKKIVFYLNHRIS